jgi:hypothetical protein
LSHFLFHWVSLKIFFPEHSLTFLFSNVSSRQNIVQLEKSDPSPKKFRTSMIQRKSNEEENKKKLWSAMISAYALSLNCSPSICTYSRFCTFQQNVFVS